MFLAIFSYRFVPYELRHGIFILSSFSVIKACAAVVVSSSPVILAQFAFS